MTPIPESHAFKQSRPEQEQVQEFLMIPALRQLNAYLRINKALTLHTISPVLKVKSDDTTPDSKAVAALQVRIQGSEDSLNAFQSFLTEANLQQSEA